MPPLRFGIMNFLTPPFEELAQRVRFAEEMGFASAWVDDDVLSMSPRGAELEAWTVLTGLARETSRIQLGTLVTVITFRHPALLAAQLITLDHLSQGRAALGLGAGGPPNNYEGLGLEVWPPRERAERLAEQAAILDPLLRGETVNFEGRYYQAHNPWVPMPVQRPRPPLIVAAHGDRGLRVVAQHADGWNSFGGQPYRVAQDPTKRLSLPEAVAETRRLSERLDGYCQEVERDPATVRRTVLAYRPSVDPLSSIDAFDEYVGRYQEIGIDEVIFYWPPLDNLYPRRPGLPQEQPVFDPPRPLSPAQQATFERIAAERIAGRLSETEDRV